MGAAAREPDCLRFVMLGSVDAGKAMLVDRLLREAGVDDVDPRDAPPAQGASDVGGDASTAVEDLLAARSRAIAADVTHRHFSTAKRGFAADVPRHAPSARSVAAATSSADVAIVVIDAQAGIHTQSRRHAFIASLMGVPRLVVAVNKMDLVAWDEAAFVRIKDQYGAFAARLHFADVTFVPMSALAGDNVATRSARMPWYTGMPLLPYLESAYIAGDANLVDFRFAVQGALRLPDGTLAHAGEVASGVVRPGDPVVVLPSAARTAVARIVAHDGDLAQALPPMAVTLCLADDVPLSGGEMLAHPGNVPPIERAVEAMMVWMAAAPLAEGNVYLVRHATRTVRGSCANLAYRVNPDTLRREPATTLGQDEIGRARLTLFEPIFADEYRRNRATGTLLLLDPETQATLGAALVVDRRASPAVAGEDADARVSRNVVWERSSVDAAERAALLHQRPLTIWLTGLSGSGKSTISRALERRLVDAGHACFVLDGDNLRHGLNRNLGFTPEDRRENVRRTAEAARLMNDAGLIVITALISPYAEDRAMARQVIGAERFFETYLAADVNACEQRDPKGLYAKARRGEIPEFTGVNAPYESPGAPAIELATGTLTVGECVDRLFAAVRPRVASAH